VLQRAIESINTHPEAALAQQIARALRQLQEPQEQALQTAVAEMQLAIAAGTFLSPAADSSSSLPQATEVLQRTIESINTHPEAALTQQVTRALRQLQEQQEQALQTVVAEMQRTIVAAVKAPDTRMLQEFQELQEQALRTQQDQFRTISDELAESVRRLGK
jgi:hypothetical protein